MTTRTFIDRTNGNSKAAGQQRGRMQEIKIKARFNVLLESGVHERLADIANVCVSIQTDRA